MCRGQCVGSVCQSCTDTSQCVLTFGLNYYCTSGGRSYRDIECVAPDHICPADTMCCSGDRDGVGNCCPLPNEVCPTDGLCCEFGCDSGGNCLLADPCEGVRCTVCEVCIDGVCQATDFCCHYCVVSHGPDYGCGEEGNCLCAEFFVDTFSGLGCRVDHGYFCSSHTDCASGFCTGNECQPSTGDADCTEAFGAGFTCDGGGYCIDHEFLDASSAWKVGLRARLV